MIRIPVIILCLVMLAVALYWVLASKVANGSLCVLALVLAAPVAVFAAFKE